MVPADRFCARFVVAAQYIISLHERSACVTTEGFPLGLCSCSERLSVTSWTDAVKEVLRTQLLLSLSNTHPALMRPIAVHNLLSFSDLLCCPDGGDSASEGHTSVGAAGVVQEADNREDACGKANLPAVGNDVLSRPCVPYGGYRLSIALQL